MSIRRTSAIAALLASPLAPSLATAQGGMDTVQVRTQTLRGGVHILLGAGGNIGLSVGDDAAFVIDDQFAPLTPKILAAIRSLTDKPVKFVLNTHWHGDHTGGNENLGKAGALIVAHDNVRKRMSTEQFIAAMNSKVPPSPAAALPVVTFTDEVTFHVNGDSVEAIHVAPAHTDGDVIVYFHKANVVHMGDVFNNTGFPFIDLSSGGSVSGIIAAADRLYAMTNAQTIVVPGHGAVADRERVRAWRNAIVAVRDGIQREVKRGKSADQVVALKLTEPYAKDFPGGQERFVRAVHEELARTKR